MHPHFTRLGVWLIGVIIENDMKYEDEHIVTDFTQCARTNQSIKGINRYDQKPQQFLKLAGHY